MSQKIKKILTLILALVMVLTGLPVKAKAAADPAFQTTYSTFYENRANQGIYDIQVNNVQKGYILKWHITGKGKKYASFDTKKIIAKGTTVTNKLTIDSNGEMAFATGERIRITVNVYTSKWKLVDKITFAGKLQSKAKSVNIDTAGIDLKKLKSGETYKFRAVMTPANATSKVYWQVKDAQGKTVLHRLRRTALGHRCSQVNIRLRLRRNSAKGAALCTKQIQATVGTFIEKIEQTASNAFRLTFATAPTAKFKETDFTVKSGESTNVVKRSNIPRTEKPWMLRQLQAFLTERHTPFRAQAIQKSLQPALESRPSLRLRQQQRRQASIQRLPTHCMTQKELMLPRQ